MKRLLLLAACATVLLSGCRNCGWWRHRGAPCRSSLSFDPYTTAPAPVAPAPVCGIDGFAGELGCGQDVTVGYGPSVDCPECNAVGGYYGDGGMQEVVPGISGGLPGGSIPVEPMPATPPPAAP